MRTFFTQQEALRIYAGPLTLGCLRARSHRRVPVGRRRSAVPRTCTQTYHTLTHGRSSSAATGGLPMFPRCARRDADDTVDVVGATHRCSCSSSVYNWKRFATVVPIPKQVYIRACVRACVRCACVSTRWFAARV